MKIPTIHLNGTSKDSLIQGYMDVHRALHVARVKLTNASPHRRDYYPQEEEDEDAFRVAQAEHYARINKIDSVLKEIEKIVEAIV